MSTNASLAVLLPLTFNGRAVPLYRSWGCAALLALQHVSTRDGSVVPQLANLSADFSFEYELFDTQQSAPATTALLLDYLYENRGDGTYVAHEKAGMENAAPRPRVVLGPAFSSTTAIASMIANAEDVPTMSYYSSAAKLSDQEDYPLLTRMYPSDVTSASVLVRMLYADHPFPDWNNVAVVYAASAWAAGYATQMAYAFDELDREMEQSDGDSRTLRTLPFVDFETGEPDRRSIGLALDAAKASGITVIVVVAFLAPLVVVIEEAIERGMLSSRYAWFVVDGKSTLTEVVGGAVSAERWAAVRRHTGGMQTFQLDAMLQPAWQRYAAAWSSFDAAACANPLFAADDAMFASAPYEPSAYAFDGVAALALALDAAGGATGREVHDELKRVRLDGASGPVAFDSRSDRRPNALKFALESILPPESAEAAAEAAAADDGNASARLRLAYVVEVTSDDDDAAGVLRATQAAPMLWAGGEGARHRPTDELYLAAKRQAGRERNMWVALGAVVLTAVLMTLGAVAIYLRARHIARQFDVSPWELLRQMVRSQLRRLHAFGVHLARRIRRGAESSSDRCPAEQRRRQRRLSRAAEQGDEAVRCMRTYELLHAAGWAEPGTKRSFTRTLSGFRKSKPYPSRGRAAQSKPSRAEADARGSLSSRFSSSRFQSSVWMRPPRAGFTGSPITRRVLTAANTDWTSQPSWAELFPEGSTSKTIVAQAAQAL